MPLPTFVADALGVATICLVVVLALLGLFCIFYSFYFRSRICGQGLIQLGYFSGPWIVRITFILFAIWWGFGEIVRLNLLRREGRLLNILHLEWQKAVCKGYIVSNLGFAEPCFFLTLMLLLHASLEKSGPLSQKWNGKTACYVLLLCLPMFVLQLMVVLIAPQFNKEHYVHRLPQYFTNTASTSRTRAEDVALCTYPLLSILILGLFATLLTAYMFWLGRRILHRVINKGLQKRVYTLIFSVSGFFPLRVLFLGLSVLSKPGHILFETLAFLAFLSLLCCAGVGVFLLVYFPVADSLALGTPQKDTEARSVVNGEPNETASLVANQIRHQESLLSNPSRSSATTESGSIPFPAAGKADTPGTFVELSLFSDGWPSFTPASPRHLPWPVLPEQIHRPPR